MATARNIISSALRKIHVLGVGDILSATEADQAFEILNDMLSSLSPEGATTYQEIKETFTLQSGKESYTIGSGQDFNTTAPMFITSAYVTQGDINYPISFFDEKEYSRITQPSLVGSVPRIYYYDANYPIANIYFYPVPSGSDTVTIYSRKPLTSFTSLDTDFTFPEHYKSMLIYNLAVWVAPEYEREANATVQRIARRTLKTVKVQNKRNEKNASLLLGIPERTRRSQNNIYTGWYI